MNRLANIVVACLAATCMARTTATPDPTARIVARVTRASGGTDAARAIHALEYRLHIREPRVEVDANYFVDRRGRMRIDVFDRGKRVFTECYDGTGAWQMGADGVAKPSSAAGRAALWHGTQWPGQILDLSELRARGHRIAFAGSETVDGIRFDVLALTLSDGFTSYRYVDPRTHRIVLGRDVRAPHPDADAKKIAVETLWRDWRSVDGVTRPFVSEQRDLASGKWLQIATVKAIRKLPSLPDTLFEAGSAPQAL